jgi:hypothetical protein
MQVGHNTKQADPFYPAPSPFHASADEPCTDVIRLRERVDAHATGRFGMNKPAVFQINPHMRRYLAESPSGGFKKDKIPLSQLTFPDTGTVFFQHSGGTAFKPRSVHLLIDGGHESGTVHPVFATPSVTVSDAEPLTANIIEFDIIRLRQTHTELLR